MEDLDLSWASHPKAALRERLALRLGRSYRADPMTATSAVVSRPKGWTKPARLLLNPFFLLYFRRRNRRDRAELTIDPNGSVVEARPWHVVEP